MLIVSGNCRKIAVEEIAPLWDALTENNKLVIMDLIKILSIMTPVTFTGSVISVTIDGMPVTMTVTFGEPFTTPTPPL
jgi:hypothetical protein